VIRGALSDPIPVPDLVNGGQRDFPRSLLNSAAGFLGSRGELDKAITLYEHLIALYPEKCNGQAPLYPRPALRN
jgi:hypothetical protein